MIENLLRAFAGLAVCLALASCSKPGSRVERAGVLCDGCNVVLVSMDTVRADHVGAYGYTLRPTTPNVDAFAARATVFEHAVSQSPWTLPAHGAMMTGLFPGQLGVVRYPAIRTLPRDKPMLAEVMARAGYATAGFTGGGFVSRHFGFERGFQTYTSGGRRFEHNIETALAWLAQNRERKFFLFFHGYDAHRPYFSHAEDKRAVGVRGRRADRTGFCGRTNRGRPADPELAKIIGYYDASIRMGDRFVGRLFDNLRDLGLMENTVVLVTADHGDEFFEHGNCDHVRFLYHEVIRVPYILYVPRLARSPGRIRELVPASISVARTLLDVVGVKNDLPGVSLEPVLRGERRSFSPVFSEADSEPGVMGSRGATIALTDDRYKLVSYLEEPSDEGYDLADDPREQHILPKDREVYGERTKLAAWHDATGAKARIARQARAAQSTVRGMRDPAEPKAQRRAAMNAGRAKSAASAASEQSVAASPSGEQAVSPAPADAPLELPEKLKEQLRSLGYAE